MPTPARVVSLSPDVTGVLLDLGLGERIVAADAESARDARLAGVAPLGDPCTADPDALAALGPDLTLLLATPCGTPLAARLRDRGLAVVLFAPETVNEIFEARHRLGALFARDSEAQHAVARMTRATSTIAMRRDGRQRLRVVWVLSHEPLEVVGADGILHEFLELAGAENGFHEPSEPRRRVSLAEIAAREPDRILDSSPGEPGGPAALGAYRTLAIPADLARLPTLELTARVQRLYDLLYPEAPAP